MITDLDIVYRLLAAALLGGLIGLEREYHHQPAGLRTHIILALGSGLAMCLSILIATTFAPDFKGDPARLAAQVITGVGFLGAGAILQMGPTVRGLTSAASIWTTAIIGMAAGAGHYVIAVAATLLVVIALSLVDVIEARFFGNATIAAGKVVLHDKPGVVRQFEQAVKQAGVKMRIQRITKDEIKETIVFNISVITRNLGDADKMLNTLRDIPELISMDIRQ